MIRRLNSNIAYALIASAVGLSGIGGASAADSGTATPGASSAATTPTSPATSTAPAADHATTGNTPSTSPATGTDTSMAPRGANPATTTNATANGPTDSPARRIFDQLDTNHDGTLTFDEFSRATFQQPAKP